MQLFLAALLAAAPQFCMQTFDPSGQPFGSFAGANLKVFSQPSGFTAVQTGSSGASLLTYAHDGSLAGITPLTTDATQVASAVDPSGGTMIIRAGADWRTTWQRFDAAGMPASDEVRLAQPLGPQTALMPAVDLLGKTFLAWYGSDGYTKTMWINPADQVGSVQMQGYFFPAQFLYSGGIALRKAPPLSWPGQWYGHVYDNRGSPSPLPPWLADRPDAWFFPVRGGAAYAVVDNNLPGQIEVVSRRGNSCGTFQTPGASGSYNFGRDGTLIAHGDAVTGISCGFRYWPQVLH
jgi:hypothetical protein